MSFSERVFPTPRQNVRPGSRDPVLFGAFPAPFASFPEGGSDAIMRPTVGNSFPRCGNGNLSCRNSRPSGGIVNACGRIDISHRGKVSPTRGADISRPRNANAAGGIPNGPHPDVDRDWLARRRCRRKRTTARQHSSTSDPPHGSKPERVPSLPEPRVPKKHQPASHQRQETAR
jgi:hypothetical protein